jgi:hypothetical protein
MILLSLFLLYIFHWMMYTILVVKTGAPVGEPVFV